MAKTTQLHFAGETLFVLDYERKHDPVRETPMVTAAEMHEQVRARLHNNRRAHQVIRVHLLLRDASVQHDEGRSPNPPTLQSRDCFVLPRADCLHII
jgi:hypothetical protein